MNKTEIKKIARVATDLGYDVNIRKIGRGDWLGFVLGSEGQNLIWIESQGDLEYVTQLSQLTGKGKITDITEL